MGFGFRAFVIFCLATEFFVSPTRAAPPDASTLFPAGGQVGQSVTVTLGGNAKPWPVQAWTDNEHLTIEADKKEGQIVVKIGPEVEPGLHWLRFHNAEGASPPRPFVVGTLAEISEQEPNNELSKSHKLSTSQTTINGKLNPAGDIDTFAVDLQQGQTLVVDVDAERPLNSPVDAVLQIVDPTGFILAQNNDDVGLDPRIEFTASQAGTHHVRLFGYSSTPSTATTFGGGDNFIYRLTITTGPFIDYAFPITVERGADRGVDLCGWGISDALRTLKLNAAGETAALRTYHRLAAGAATVRVTDLPAAIEREPNDLKQPQAVTLPVVLSGRCAPAGDVDCFAFDAKKGQRLAAKVEARSLGFITDPVLMVLNDQGEVLLTVDDANQQRDCELGFNFPADGRYRVAVRDLYRSGSQRHVYLLTLRIDQPDYSLTLGATEYVVAKGKSVEIPLTIDRRLGFAEEITFEVRGFIPKGTMIELPKSLAKGDTAKGIKLKVSGGDAPFAGPIEIVGLSQGDKKLSRTAGLVFSDRLEPWTQVWLTVAK